MPRLEELSIKKMTEMMKDDKALAAYLPDEYLKQKTADRTYFFNILNTLYPEYVQQLLSHAHKQRTGMEQEQQQEQTIEMHEDWVDLLSQVPFYSKSKYPFTANHSIGYREGPDIAPAEAIQQTNSHWEEEEEVQHTGFTLRVQVSSRQQVETEHQLTFGAAEHIGAGTGRCSNGQCPDEERQEMNGDNFNFLTSA